MKAIMFLILCFFPPASVLVHPADSVVPGRGGVRRPPRLRLLLRQARRRRQRQGQQGQEAHLRGQEGRLPPPPPPQGQWEVCVCVCEVFFGRSWAMGTVEAHVTVQWISDLHKWVAQSSTVGL